MDFRYSLPQQKQTIISLATKMSAILAFAGRHLIASLVSVGLPVAVVTVTYFVLLVIAILTDTGVGGPLALPFWVLLTLVVSLGYTSLLLFPVVAVAEIVSRAFGRWQHVAQVPLSTVFLALFAVLLMAVISLINQPHLSLKQWFNYSVLAFLVMTAPLGIYWWTMKFTQAILFAVTSSLAWIGRKVFSKLSS